MLFGFGAKAGMFPLHFWLPKALPVAAGPASALLSGILTKCGILGILVLTAQVFVHDLTWGSVILTLGVFGMVVGAVLAGAKFIVSPGFDPEIVDYCLSKNILVLPGCITPSEVAQAVKRGLEVIKFFPAEQFGGIATIKALAAPYTNVKFMPTGGISAKNQPDYLSFKKIVACGGSWMVKGDMIEAGEFDKIRDMTKEAVDLVATIRK